MPIKNILLHLTDDPRNQARIDVASNLAQAHESHLTALFSVTMPVMPTYAMGYIPADVFEQYSAQAKAKADKVKVEFEDYTRRQEIASEWRVEEGDAALLLAMHAAYADLVIVGQTGVGDDRVPGTYDLPDELVMTCGRPVLSVPYAGKFKTVGDRVLIAWNGTREATRAVHDSMPVLRRASHVIVYSVNAPSSEHIPGADICTHLARHGVTAEAKHTVARDIEVGDALLAAVADFSCDLLVMGGYGHSRFRELTLGGATRHLMGQMTIPVMMSH